MILNIEADEIAYRCAFACQKQAYIWHGTNKSIDLGSKFTKTKIKNFFEPRGKRLDEHYKLEPYTMIEPEHIVDYTLDCMLKKLQSLVHDDLGSVEQMNLWLSPSDHSNFRYSISTIPGPHGMGYKAGRPDKPVHLKYIKEKMIHEYGAKEVFGYEADDALGMYQTDRTVAVHIDKDINMIPGWHYHHVKEEFSFCPKSLGILEYKEGKLTGKGTIFFYAQMLTGDPTDNIPGIPKIGPKKAYDLLNGCQIEEDCVCTVYTQYKNYYGNAYALSALYEIADLLWIVREDKKRGSAYLMEYL